MAGAVLKGITWGHSRGFTPLVAASQRYAELHPGVEIQWKKRTLQEFADFPIEKLTQDYDLLIIDHPWVGCAAATQCVLPLDQYFDAAYLDDQQRHSTGYSHLSYYYNDHQWALAVDAATPAASYRPDLLSAAELPTTWEELIALVKKGRVAVPAIPIDLLMNFYTFCIAHGKEPFQSGEEIIDRETGIRAIETMKELYSVVDEVMFTCNPIAVAERMSSTDDYWYCPFAYCYSNYARTGYAKKLLLYTDVVSFNNKKLRTTIGGTGLAISAFGRHRNIAIDFSRMVASEEFQRTVYVQHGGQPGHLAAWQDEEANRLTHDFFKNVLPVMENGYVRPRYNGYLHFQDHAGLPLQQCLRENGRAEAALDAMNRIYRESLSQQQPMIAL